MVKAVEPARLRWKHKRCVTFYRVITSRLHVHVQALTDYSSKKTQAKIRNFPKFAVSRTAISRRLAPTRRQRFVARFFTERRGHNNPASNVCYGRPCPAANENRN